MDAPECRLTRRLHRCRHAGRSTINVSDVMLLARRNEGLESILRAFVDQQREGES
jgi:hypothetical protein